MVPGLTRDLVHEWSRRIDGGPYSSLALGERITFPNVEVMVTMTTAAAITERVDLMFTVIVLPMHSEALIAKQVATLDVLSGGRMILGVGSGWLEEEFRALGVSFDDRGDRTDEAIRVLRAAWTDGVASFEGRFTSFDDLYLRPLPVQRPVPIWCTVMKTPASFEWLAETGYGAIIGNPYQVDADLATGLQLYLASREKRNLSSATEQVWALLNAFVDHDDAFAREYPRRSVEQSIEVHRQYSNPFERGGEIPADYKAYADWFDKHDDQTYEQILNADLTLMGSPDRIIPKMSKIVDMGWQNLMLRMSRGGAMERDKVRSSMELFSREVMPAVAELESAQV